MEFKRRCLPFVIGVVAFFAYAAFPLISPPLYNSPDDSANNFFIAQFAEHRKVWYQESLNNVLEGRIVTRSMRAIGDRVVPIGFPGLSIVYGALAVLFSIGLVKFFTPLFVALSAALLFRAVEKKWGTWMGFIAATMYAFNPALWYYASRGLYPNALAIALVTIGAALMFIGNGSRIKSGMTIFCIALAIFIRPIEAIWILPLVLVFPWRWRGVCAIGVGLIAAAVGNYWVYGSLHATGYSVSLAASDAFSTTAPTIRSLAGRIVHYAGYLFPIHAIAALAAFVWLARKPEHRKPLAFLALIALIVLVPYAYLGARDIVGTGIPTIGTSFVRYWLPAFLIGSIVMVMAMKEIRSRVAVGAMLVIYIAISFHAVWFGTADSLSPVLASLQRYESIKQETLPMIEPNAIVIAEQADKVFFPDRRVAAWLRNPGMIEAIPEMLQFAPVYYYGLTLPQADLDVIKTKAPTVKLEMLRTFGIESLYRFSQ